MKVSLVSQHAWQANQCLVTQTTSHKINGTAIQLLACAAVWVTLNFMLIACIDERTDWNHDFAVDTNTLLAYQPISSRKSRRAGLQARFLAPSRFRSPVPLVIFLHGAGQRGNDNIQQLQTLPKQLFHSGEFSCAVLAPQCPSHAWWGSTMPELERLIEQTIQQYNIDSSRVYLTGVSMGGYGSWELAARRPDLFAAVVPVCGGGQIAWAASLKDVPLWAVHGGDDTVVRPELSREMVRAIQAQGGSPHYTELPGVGHNSWKYAYDSKFRILTWMFQQQRLSGPR